MEKATERPNRKLELNTDGDFILIQPVSEVSSETVDAVHDGRIVANVRMSLDSDNTPVIGNILMAQFKQAVDPGEQCENSGYTHDCVGGETLTADDASKLRRYLSIVRDYSIRNDSIIPYPPMGEQPVLAILTDSGLHISATLSDFVEAEGRFRECTLRLRRFRPAEEDLDMALGFDGLVTGYAQKIAFSINDISRIRGMLERTREEVKRADRRTSRS